MSRATRRVKNGRFVLFACAVTLIAIVFTCFLLNELRKTEETGKSFRTMIQSGSTKRIKGTTIEVAYGKEGAMDPYLVRIRPFPSGGHELIHNFGKKDDQPEDETDGGE